MQIKVYVLPDSRKESFLKESENVYRINVREPAANNQANLRVRELLAERLGLNAGKVKLISGHRSPTKKFDVQLQDKT